jgi:hypothetical protein
VRAVSEETLGAWLLKASPTGGAVARLARDGFAAVQSRCVRPGYRADLVRPGQRVLLWVSGADLDHPAGVHAAGWTTGEVDGDQLPVRLVALEQPVLRRELLAHPVLRDLEVLRMPAGSNPSYLTREQWAVLRDEHPEVLVAPDRLGLRS